MVAFIANPDGTVSLDDQEVARRYAIPPEFSANDVPGIVEKLAGAGIQVEAPVLEQENAQVTTTEVTPVTPVDQELAERYRVAQNAPNEENS